MKSTNPINFNRLSIFPTILAAVVLAAAPGLPAAAEGGDQSRSLKVSAFDRIEIAGIYELDVVVGAGFSIELSGDDDDLARVKVSVKDGTLLLEQDNAPWYDLHHEGVKAIISMPALRSLDVSGVVDGEIGGIAADTFTIDVSGVADLTLTGECGVLTVRVSGIGDLGAEKLQCKSVDISLSGIGDASVYASEDADANISGIGEIDIHGSPARVRKNAGMFSEINVR